jgi:hypothetical protein
MASKKGKAGQLTVAEMGALGGAARAKSMSKKERSESARIAAKARWDAKKKGEKENA